MNINAVQLSLNKNLTAENTQTDPKLKKVCNDFVSILYQQMLSTMQESSEVDGGLFENKGGYKDFSNYLFNQIMSKEVIKQNGQGLADKLYDQLIRK